MLSAIEIQRKVKEIYDVEIDPRTIRRNINLPKYKLEYDISAREENGKGYYINRDPETDFEPGEIRAIIDNFSYANYIVPSVAKEFIKKCKKMQNVYENEKLKDYQIYSVNSKTENAEVIKNKVLEVYNKLKLTNIKASDKIIKRAYEIRKYNIKDMDSLHIAYAESFNIDYFITTDKLLINASKRAGLK